MYNLFPWGKTSYSCIQYLEKCLVDTSQDIYTIREKVKKNDGFDECLKLKSVQISFLGSRDDI
jgi:hypothetical protein